MLTVVGIYGLLQETTVVGSTTPSPTAECAELAPLVSASPAQQYRDALGRTEGRSETGRDPS